MLWSGSAPLTVARDTMWGFLLVAGAAWLAIAWTVLRLEPADVVSVAGPVILFGALCEAVRALAGTKTWWLNASTAVLFTATGALLLADRDSAYATPESLVAWYLMVRGALDIAVSVMNRGTDRTWGLLLTLGMAQAGLGFYAAGPAARSADPVILTLGGLAMLRAIADLATALRLREVSHARHDILRLSPEREAGVAGYSAGLSDYPGTTSHARPRHRAIPAAPAATMAAETTMTSPLGTTAAWPPAAAAGGPAGAAAAGPADTAEAGAPPDGAPRSFHDEVLRTTADLDAMIAQAGVTGSGTAQHRIPEDLPSVPDTPAGVDPEAATRVEDAAATEDTRRH